MIEKTGVQSNLHYFSPLLLKKLENILTVPVTVVEAPSGYGKTTAIRDYLNNHLNRGTPLYWWSAVQNEPLLSWMRLCRELEFIDPLAGKQLSAMGFPKLMTAWEIEKAIKNIHCNTSSVLVLDDFHYLQKEMPQTVMTALLSHNAAKLHLIIITQTARPFPLLYFRQAPVYYIGKEDLSFKEEDVRHYCKLCKIEISESEARHLYEYTEGWVVALCLTVIQKQRGEGFNLGLSLLQLMESIVWQNMSDQGRNLFLHIALFPSVIIEQLSFLLQVEPLPDNYFTLLEETPFVRYEREEHCYVPHAILRETLLRRMKAADLETKNSCYRRAGAWHARNGEILKALGLFFMAKDYEAILALPLVGLTLARVNDLPFTRLAAELLLDCPMEIKRKYPIALLQIAYALIGADKLAEARDLLKDIKAMIMDMDKEEWKQKLLLGEWTLVSAYLDFPDIVKMEPVMMEAASMIGGRCRTLTAEEPFAFGLPLMIFFHRTPGGLDREMEALSKVVSLLHDLTGVKSGAHVLFKAEAALYRGFINEAEPLAHQAAYLAAVSKQWTIRTGTVNLLAQLAVKKGSDGDLSQYIKELEESVGSDSISPFVTEMLQADYYMWLGLTHLIPAWIREGRAALADVPSWVKIYVSYYHMGILLQEEEYVRLLGIGETIIADCREAGYLMVEIYMHFIVAMAFLKTGRTEEAFASVQQALARAKPDSIYLPFMEFRCALDGLVEKVFFELGENVPMEITSSSQIIGDNWKLLIRLSSESRTLPHGLSEREMEVATLAAKGMSNKEIASALFISETTVKFHLRSVFAKLGIDRRGKLAGILE